MLNDIDSALNSSEGGNLTKRRIEAGRGVSAFGMITRGQAPRQVAAAGVGPPVNVFVELDGEKVADVVIKKGQVRDRRQPKTRGGRLGGR
jgi:hypothetical protein